MAKHKINPAPGSATGWGKYRSGEEYELTDEQAERFRKRGIIGPAKKENEAADDTNIQVVAEPTGGTGIINVGPRAQPAQDDPDKRDKKPGRNAVPV